MFRQGGNIQKGRNVEKLPLGIGNSFELKPITQLAKCIK